MKVLQCCDNPLMVHSVNVRHLGPAVFLDATGTFIETTDHCLNCGQEALYVNAPSLNEMIEVSRSD